MLLGLTLILTYYILLVLCKLDLAVVAELVKEEDVALDIKGINGIVKGDILGGSVYLDSSVKEQLEDPNSA